MLHNLQAEIKRSGLSQFDISKELGINERTLRLKLTGKTSFTFPEAEQIRNRFFPGMKLEYLFFKEVE